MKAEVVPNKPTISVDVNRAQELCESRGGRHNKSGGFCGR